MRFLITFLSIFFISGPYFHEVRHNFQKRLDPTIFGWQQDQKNESTGMLSGKDPVTIALLTDLHVTPGLESDSSLQLIVSEINQTNIDFTVVTGDLSNTGSDAELLAVKRALDRLIKPCYVLPGNHETNWSESAGLTFNKLWGNDRFFFKKNGYLFVGFNTGPYMKMGDGIVKQEDLQWLTQQLRQKKLKDEVLISFTHYPLSDGLDNWVQVTDLLKTFSCRMDICGHGHRLGLYNFNGIPGIMGRSVVSGNSNIPGYNIIKLRNDSVLIYNKELSGYMGKPAIMLNFMKADTLSKIAISQIPDFSVNQVYHNRRVVAEWSDTASILSGPCLVNDTILVYGNSIGWVKAISIINQRIVWQTQIHGPVYSTPVSSEGKLVLGTVGGSVLGLDALTGKKLWEVNTGRPVLAEGVIEDGFVYIGGGDKAFYKVDLTTGKIAWQFTGIEGLVQGKPFLSGSYVVFGAWDRYLYCIDKDSGLLKWKWNNGKPQKLYSPGNIFPVCSDNKVFIVAPDRFMTAIDINTGKEVWRTGKHQVRESMGASHDGSLVYAKLMNDTVIAVSALKNYPATVWTVNAGFGYEHNPCPILSTNDFVIAGTRTGILVIIDAKTSGIVSKYKAGNSAINKVVVDQNKTFWFTMMEGKIIGLRII